MKRKTGMSKTTPRQTEHLKPLPWFQSPLDIDILICPAISNKL